MKNAAMPTRAAKILTAAIDKTEKVQDELKEAAETLSVSNAALSTPHSRTEAMAAVAGALEQNTAAETKVQDAAQELESVKDLIKEAQIQQVQQGAQGEPGRMGEGTASILAYFEGRRAQARDDDAERAKG